jgi:hypothetical protein
MERLYNRRSKRLALQVPVRVYGQVRVRGAFREEVRTLSISAHGSLVPLVTPVELGQVLVVMNRMTGEEQECRVAYVGPVAEGKSKVGLAFRHPAPHFWQVDFPQAKPASQPTAPHHHAHAVAAHRGYRR